MESASQMEREIRAARNQALFRAVNDKMLELNEVFEQFVGSYSIACECSRMDCVTLIELPPDAYRAVRASPHTFVVCPGHVQDEVERVVSSHDGYAVVEVLGHGVQVAEATFLAGRATNASGR